ncbi:unnamed protein product [Sphenostylis stenocarpa]|uniref:Uncharacterized protein n=1 Tax=Sphenostylis stenocarpa TaxID=92480 RepID=A0AA86RM67_9FABA|nr:unnamed protein product [Sphenostylis stenocarpa]
MLGELFGWDNQAIVWNTLSKIEDSRRCKEEKASYLLQKMGNWKAWRYFKRISIYPIKIILLKVTSNFRFKSEGKTTSPMVQLTSLLSLLLFVVLNTGRGNGLLSLYKDMESCGEYADIQVMWKMIESSSPQNACHKKRVNRSSYCVVCFRPT